MRLMIRTGINGSLHYFFNFACFRIRDDIANPSCALYASRISLWRNLDETFHLFVPDSFGT
jgi:hypothetical protein